MVANLDERRKIEDHLEKLESLYRDKKISEDIYKKLKKEYDSQLSQMKSGTITIPLLIPPPPPAPPPKPMNLELMQGLMKLKTASFFFIAGICLILLSIIENVFMVTWIPLVSLILGSLLMLSSTIIYVRPAYRHLKEYNAPLFKTSSVLVRMGCMICSIVSLFIGLLGGILFLNYPQQISNPYLERISQLGLPIAAVVLVSSIVLINIGLSIGMHKLNNLLYQSMYNISGILFFIEECMLIIILIMIFEYPSFLFHNANWFEMALALIVIMGWTLIREAINSSIKKIDSKEIPPPPPLPSPPEIPIYPKSFLEKVSHTMLYIVTFGLGIFGIFIGTLIALFSIGIISPIMGYSASIFNTISSSYLIILSIVAVINIIIICLSLPKIIKELHQHHNMSILLLYFTTFIYGIILPLEYFVSRYGGDFAIYIVNPILYLATGIAALNMLFIIGSNILRSKHRNFRIW